MSDMVRPKLDTARLLGVHHTFRADMPNLAAAAVEAAGGAFDVCFECCAVPSALNTCVAACASGGVVCLVANLKETSTLRLQEFISPAPPLYLPCILHLPVPVRVPVSPRHLACRSARGARLTSSACIATVTCTPPRSRSCRAAASISSRSCRAVSSSSRRTPPLSTLRQASP